MPVYANFGALAGVSPSSQESQTGVTNPYMPNPFFVQSRTGYMNHPPVYYSQNLG
nr:unknown [Zea mays]